MPFLWLPYLCTSWSEAGLYRKGEGRLLCFGFDQMYGCIVSVCLKFPCTAQSVLRSRSRGFYNADVLSLSQSWYKCVENDREETLGENILVIAKDIWIIHVNFIVIAVTHPEKNIGGITFVQPLANYILLNLLILFSKKITCRDSRHSKYEILSSFTVVLVVPENQSKSEAPC
jgi:hypothetical protein